MNWMTVFAQNMQDVVASNSIYAPMEEGWECYAGVMTREAADFALR
jgi:hypothetical protein